MEHSKSVVHYAGGIPLALEVLGSYLSGQSVDEWEIKLKKLKETIHPSVQNILEISYHSLGDTEKDIFLDIACFFIGYDKNYIISILDGCGFYADDGINTLVKRCLLKIDFCNQLVIHDLIRDMGRQIVFQECPKDCGGRSRVWHHEEAFNLLQDETGTKAVEGLRLNLPGSDELFTKGFKEMKRLRLLHLNSVNIFGSCEHISKKLRWLCWSKFPLESIPTDLHLGNVVVLDMPYSSLKQLWEGKKVLGKLKILNLSHSHGLTKTSNLEGLPNLEILILEDCPNLVEVHESIGLLTELVTLNLKDCRNLEKLPRSICVLRSLEDLKMSGCSKPSPMRGPNLSGFLPVSLRKLNLSFCDFSDDVIPNYLQNLPLLKHLDLRGNSFSRLPPTISLLPELESLRLDGCGRLKSVPELPPSLLVLIVWDCMELERINVPNSNRLKRLGIRGCGSLVELKGAFKLEPVGMEIVKKLLEPYGLLTTEESIANFRVFMYNDLTQRSHISRGPQGFFEDGIYSIFLPGSEILSCCSHQNDSNSVSFKVSQPQGCKIVGFIICAVCASSEFFKPDPKGLRLWITIYNMTKMFKWSYDPTVNFLNEKPQEDSMWLSYWSFENAMEDREREDQNWRFKNEMEEGDEVVVHIYVFPHIQVKKCGVNLLYQQNDQINELTLIPHASSAYHTWFAKHPMPPKFIPKRFGYQY